MAALCTAPLRPAPPRHPPRAVALAQELARPCGDPRRAPTGSLFGTDVRIAYYDLGPKDAVETLLLTHGEPSWSYLYRHMIPPLLAKGHRLLLFDQVGFGRSDKPAREQDYSYERHVAWGEDLLINHLDLHNVTGVFQDWGGLLGLRVVAAHPDRFRRLVIANTFMPVCDDSFFEVSDGFYGWKRLAARSQLQSDGEGGGGEHDMLANLMGGAGTGLRLPQGDLRLISAEERLAYIAPFPSDEYRAGARRFPELVPTSPSDPTGRPQPLGGEENRRAWTECFDVFQKPVITAFGDEDTVMAGAEKIWQERCPGCRGQAHTYIKGANHFLQDGGAAQLTDVILNFIAANPPVHKEFIEPLPGMGFSGAVKFTVPGTGVTQITVSGAVGEGGGAKLEQGAEAALASLTKTLRAAGASLADIVKINTYIVDMDEAKVGLVAKAMHKTFRHLPDTQRAASTWVGVTSLVSPGLGVEIECTAIIPEQKTKTKL